MPGKTETIGVEDGVWILIKGFVAGAILPVLMASILSAPWGRRRGKVGAIMLFGLMSCVGAIVTSGLAVPGDTPALHNLIQAARSNPPAVLIRELPPRLAQMLVALGMRAGTPLSPQEVQRRVGKMMECLMRIRSIPAEEFEPRAPQLVAQLLQEAGGAPLVGGLVFSPYTDDALVVVGAAGLTGGFVVGLGSAVVGVVFRGIIGSVPPPFLIPTMVVGLAGALAGRRATFANPSPLIRTGRRGFATGVLAGIAQIAWVLYLSPPGYLSPGVIVGGAALVVIHGTGLGLFAVVMRVQRLEDQHREAREAQVRARLALLTAQIKPHFLFNALNTIAASCAPDADRTRHLIGSLADFLRLSLKPGAGQVTLDQELRHLESYLELERARFPDRLRIQVEVTPPAGGAYVPALLMQPLVENAVAHGMRPGGEVLNIVVSGTIRGDRLVLTVRDDGEGVSPLRLCELSRGIGLGIGLGSVKERVEAIDPPGTFELESTPGRGFVVEIELALG